MSPGKRTHINFHCLSLCFHCLSVPKTVTIINRHQDVLCSSCREGLVRLHTGRCCDPDPINKITKTQWLMYSCMYPFVAMMVLVGAKVSRPTICYESINFSPVLLILRTQSRSWVFAGREG